MFGVPGRAGMRRPSRRQSSEAILYIGIGTVVLILIIILIIYFIRRA